MVTKELFDVEEHLKKVLEARVEDSHLQTEAELVAENNLGFSGGEILEDLCCSKERRAQGKEDC